MKIAITTAGGNLGRAIVKESIDEFGRENVIGIARTPEKAKDLGVEIRKGDYNLKADFLEALREVELLVLISGLDAPEKRIIQHRNVIEAAKESGVRKIIYNSIFGTDGGSAFDAIIKSNRQTEEDVINSGMEWAVGRNGLYLEPDVEYLEKYKKEGQIINCAGEGKCAYTSRSELALAYVNLAKNEHTNGNVYNLTGEAITQSQLADYLNQSFKTSLAYQSISFEAYKEDRIKEYGDFFGNVIAGIYLNIRNGSFDVESDFEKVTGRPHKSHLETMKEMK